MKSITTICVFFYDRLELFPQIMNTIFDNVKIAYNLIVINDGPKKIEQSQIETISPKIPVDIEDSFHVVMEMSKRLRLGEKKNFMLRLIDTPYFTKLDNDQILTKGSIERQINWMEKNPDIASVSGISTVKGRVPPYIGVGNYVYLLNKYITVHRPTSKQILAHEGLYYADEVPEGLTTFRTKAFTEGIVHGFDEKTDIGFDHPDVFLTLKIKGWKACVDNRCFIEHAHYDRGRRSPEYVARVRASREYFIKKWGVIPIDEFSQSFDTLLLNRLQRTYDFVRRHL